MALRFLVGLVALAVTPLAAQTPPGEIAGRMSDEQTTVMPGVRVRIANGDQSSEAVTDGDGRFRFRSLTMGTYRVVAEIPGLKTASGEITLSPSTPTAFLAWSLEPGCLEQIQRVVLGPRAAARLADAIVHIRVAGAAGPVRMSVHPDCAGRVFDEYTVEALGSTSERGRRGPGQRRMFIEPSGARLTPGQEYLVLLWPDGSTTEDLVLPIVSGRVVSPNAGELNGLRAVEALNLLARWSEERQP